MGDEDKSADNKAIERALNQFFTKANGIVGSEANYQVLLAVELEKEYPGKVRREHRMAETGRGGVDVVVLSEEGEALAAFELKGGAYNSRNALQDVFTEDGNCQDMNKLSKLKVVPAHRWLVAVDAIELGRSLSYRKQIRAAETAGSYNVSFAYHGHGDKTFLLAPSGGRVRYPEIGTMQPEISGKSIDLSTLITRQGVERDLIAASQSIQLEADIVTIIYRSLLAQGYSAKQIALETYFNFAPGNMHQRPDICLFAPGVDGHFNLYPEGNTSRSYDSLKLSMLKLLVEVKGGRPLLGKKDSTLQNIYRKDIEKLNQWKVVINGAAQRLSLDIPDTAFLFIGVDLRPYPIHHDVLATISGIANENNICFHYVHSPN
ncbi:MAG: hypothetical protein C0631_13300 [Sedimenticola sp.]|nr:MAG: hypothetical protein C0631_13300 [Sedimenticola sp.]